LKPFSAGLIRKSFLLTKHAARKSGSLNHFQKAKTLKNHKMSAPPRGQNLSE